MKAPIPLRNLYHMLCYAWDVLPQADLINVDSEGERQPPDLLASVLTVGVRHLLRRGVEKGYLERCEDLSVLRGRVDFAYTAGRGLDRLGRARCRFDELSEDILSNRILLATLERLARLDDLAPEQRKECALLARRFHGVSRIKPKPALFSSVRFHDNNRFYRFLISVCELAYFEVMPSETTGRYRFRDFFRNEGKMPKLYERFIYNFYRKRQQEYRVSSERLYWDAVSEDDPELLMLPSMLTDISLRSPERTLIIDAKYYRETLNSFHGNKRIHSSNLYQINAYLQSVARKGGNDAEAEGILLYPVVQEEVSAGYTLNGRQVRIETVDLSLDWHEIEARLSALIKRQ